MNSNPYEAIVNGSSRRAEKRPNPQSSVLARAGKRRQMRRPHNRLAVRHRYQFEMPPPTMDPKMLLGDMSMAAYNAPHLTSLELDARPLTAPGDPLFGLRVDLVGARAPADLPSMSVSDQALLIEIEQDRPAGAGAGPQKRETPAQAPASWMRRMSYDEYTAKSSTAARPLVNVNTKGKQPLTSLSSKRTEKKQKLKPAGATAARSVERSFFLANKMPKHPDKRKQNLRPISVVPVFPDFLSAGAELIAAEFEKNASVTHEAREGDEDMLKRSKQALATISLADGDSKFLACFTPTDETLETIAEDEKVVAPTGEKELMYEWVEEYSIREAARKKDSPTEQRGCFALSVHEGSNGKRVAILGRVGTNWKLSRRDADLPRLGKSHMRLTSTSLSKEDEDDKLKSSFESIEKTC